MGGLEIYDNPEIQASFVRPLGEICEAVLLLEGIRCGACVWLNEQVLSRIPGVISANVNYATRRAQLRWDPKRVRLSTIMEAIQAIGYRARPYDARRVDLVHRDEQRQALGRLFVAGFGMMQVMMYAVPVYLADTGDMSWDIEQLFRWAGLALTLPVMGYSAAPFFRGAARYLALGKLGMDVPVALGLSIAFCASIVATLEGRGEVYYDSISMFVFLLLLGRHLELLARHRATRALQYLGRIEPESAERLLGFPASSATERVPATALRPGEHVIVGKGQRVPADGVLECGDGPVDESLLSGEASPVHKRSGDPLIGGSINLANPIVVRVTCVGADTVLSSIMTLVERAAGEKHQLAVLADRVTGVFVLSILVLSGAAAAYWSITDPAKAVWITVSVLVATCPCAFSLATPLALAAATGELARRGFVVTRAHAVEVLGRVTDVVLDKTGTLTRGSVRLLDLVPTGAHSRDRCLQLAAALEAGDAHPIAAAIRHAARQAGGDVPAAEDIEVYAGRGVEGTVKGQRFRIGTPLFAAEWSVPRTDGGSEEDGGTVLLADRSGVLARLYIGDELRPDAVRAVAAFRRLGLELHLLTGDAGPPARQIAGKLAIRHLVARALPADKRSYVRRLQDGGAIVAMVGDGINDTPVLAQADVSVTMGSGAYLAQAQGDAVLVSGRLEDLAWAAGHARKTYAVIRQNIAWAFAYNLAVLPMAIAGAIAPWVAAIGMSASSLLVVLNALRLAVHGHPRASAVPGEVAPATA